MKLMSGRTSIIIVLQATQNWDVGLAKNISFHWEMVNVII